MATQANVARLLDTPGFKVIDCKTEGDLLWVELRGHKRRRPVCSGCGQPAPPSAIHDRKLRTVRDLACFGRRTYLRIEIVRVACPVCGVRVERLGFLHSNPRYSRRFAYQVARLCLAMPVSSAAALKPLEPPEDLRWIGVDEKSWRRGRRFCTVVSDLESGRVIWLAPGHSGEALAEFFAWLGERRSERIEAAAIDLSHSYEETIRRHCPGVAIVYDRYHVAKLLLEALNDVRKQVVKAAAAEERPLLTNKKWLLLRHERGLDQDGAQEPAGRRAAGTREGRGAHWQGPLPREATARKRRDRPVDGASDDENYSLSRSLRFKAKTAR